MTETKSMVSLSPLKERRFGVRTARAGGVTTDSLPAILAFCRENKMELLIAPCLSSDIAVAQTMEFRWFLLMDPLVYYALDLKRLSEEDPGNGLPGLFRALPCRPSA